MALQYSFRDNDALVVESTSGKVVGKGKIVKSQPCGSEGMRLVVYDVQALKMMSGLLMVDANGDVIWQAVLPWGDDAVVDVRIDHNAIIANTWQGFQVLVDAATGLCEKARFVK